MSPSKVNQLEIIKLTDLCNSLKDENKTALGELEEMKARLSHAGASLQFTA